MKNQKIVVIIPREQKKIERTVSKRIDRLTDCLDAILGHKETDRLMEIDSFGLLLFHAALCDFDVDVFEKKNVFSIRFISKLKNENSKSSQN